MKITSLWFNWFYTDSGDEYTIYTLGKKVNGLEVIEIIDMATEQSVAYQVNFSDGTGEIIFNPNKISFIPEQEIKP